MQDELNYNEQKKDNKMWFYDFCTPIHKQMSRPMSKFYITYFFNLKLLQVVIWV